MARSGGHQCLELRPVRRLGARMVHVLVYDGPFLLGAKVAQVGTLVSVVVAFVLCRDPSVVYDAFRFHNPSVPQTVVFSKAFFHGLCLLFSLSLLAKLCTVFGTIRCRRLLLALCARSRAL